MSGGALFLYGTLLDSRVFRRFAGQALPRHAMPARLTGHRRVLLRGTPYPTLMRDDSSEVAGLLVPRLSPSALERLSVYEGAAYHLLPVTIMTPRGRRRARAWIAPPFLSDPRMEWTIPSPHARK